MLKKVLSWFLIGSGAFMFLGFLASTKDQPFYVDIVMLALFVGLPILGGIALLRGDRKAKALAADEARKLLLAAQEKEILQLAAQKKGVLTVSQIVRETSITTADAELLLHEMIVKRMADIHTTAEGQAVYEFPEYADMQDFEQRRTQQALLKE